MEMPVNFCPNREQMVKEVEECIESSKLDVLMSLCTCCVYKIFDESTLVSQCMRCSVQQGISKISGKNKWTASPDMEFLGVC